MAEQFMLVHFTDDLAEGVRFSEWPQHLTVLPWAVGNLAVAAEELSKVAASLEPVEYRVEQQEMFGRNQSISAWIVGPRAALTGIHKAFLQGMHAAVLSNTKFVDDEYQPHITQRQHQRWLIPRNKLVLDSVAIVAQEQRHKVIHKRLVIGDENTA